MKEAEVEQILQEAYPGAEVFVEDISCSRKKFHIEIKHEDFAGMSRVKSHQAIMAHFKEELLSGDIHGLTIQVSA